MPFVARKKWLFQKIKNFTILINLKWIQLLRCFYWLKTNLWQILGQILDKILKDRAYEIPRNYEYDG